MHCRVFPSSYVHMITFIMFVVKTTADNNVQKVAHIGYIIVAVGSVPGNANMTAVPY